VSLVLLSGCFTYVPTEWDAVPPGERVRVHLTRQGLADLPDGPYGQTLSGALSGTLMDAEAGQLLVRIPLGVRQEALVTRSLGQDVTIATGEVVLLERRTFDSARTGFAVAGGIAGVVAAILVFGAVQNSPDPNPDPGEGEGFLMRLFSVPFG
jgi:hypothetical protein